MCRRFDFRNPPPAWRVFLVAVVLAVPGALAGGMVSLYLGDFLTGSVVGGLAGAVFGAVLEAPAPTPDDTADEADQEAFGDSRAALVGAKAIRPCRKAGRGAGRQPVSSALETTRRRPGGETASPTPYFLPTS